MTHPCTSKDDRSMKTTSVQALYKEAGLKPAETFLNTIVRRAAIQTRRLDDPHQLHRRAARKTSRQPLIRFARSLVQKPLSESINPLIQPPLGARGITK